MKKKGLSRMIAATLSFALAASCLPAFSIVASADTVSVPEPLMVYDFSHSIEELQTLDPGMEVVENGAKPEIVADETMGNVLKLGKAIVTEDSQKFMPGTLYIQEDTSEYSTINITNPFKDSKDKLVEYDGDDHAQVEIKKYESCMQPYWKTGVTISYWIKTSGKISNVLGFRNNKYMLQADDYAKYLCTVDFDKEYNSRTDEQRAELGVEVVNCGVDWNSDYFFKYENDDPNNIQEYISNLRGPVYVSVDDMGDAFWMNKFYTVGYVPKSDGKGYDPSSENGTGRSGNYADYHIVPEFPKEQVEVPDNGSKLRYGWAKGEMWLDSTSSFYFEGDNDVTVQENPHADKYMLPQGMQNGNCFAINSWYGGYQTLEEAMEDEMTADSPVTVKPDEWHLVTCIIQNDWVEYYLDGKNVDVKNTYSSYGSVSIGGAVTDHIKPWKRFNKGGGSRYGYGNNKNYVKAGTNGNYVCEVIMDWLTDDVTTATIGGGNTSGDGYNMFANTDEIEIKNIVFYDEMLTDDQIAMLAKKENANYYAGWGFEQPGDADGDGSVTSSDALKILRIVAKLDTIDPSKVTFADVDGDGDITSADALGILQYAAKLISSFDELKK